MTDAEFRLFLNGGMFLCSVMAAINLFRQRKRGVAALVLSAAFLAAGACLYLLRQGAGDNAVYAAAALTFLLLLADVILRSRDLEAKRRGDT